MVNCLTKGDGCTVELTVQHPLCTDPIGHKGSRAKATSLSRIVLRDRGETVAAGLIV
ncbi:hypothetical protein Pmar_PMAR020332 [Perkinsus marinus ATCC 50983]|uniref:GTP-eEF1A C-terminal domain-containing protein n=1 Tax=Perkinsus marinus (strain ATCC 50983 / TXsc) TaxID=423536 RepID=C5KFE3_PERM5|nr:hypothetical protein Pmar_PMAR020332 [Perkinsus marinus ATCC 50983]EER16803.1 hypothetical protein Pmar_PMAR020332 [Perkinsus marinus ATCC 50983]|eukprot:XP_002785007.1 hypothetical protein Pmar_PMAR020332 [Perkinsus marinus ATCC 50983]